ncbi:MAG: hypothetical protein EOO90_17105 [Pedobacter sp.]|nr:MAG: hypothetical protein EOO90_17105 [Pedobacter sp.]
MFYSQINAAEGCLVGTTVYTRYIGPVYGGILGNRPQYDQSATFTLPVMSGCPINSQLRIAVVTNLNPYLITQHCGFTANFNNNGPGQSTHTFGQTVSYDLINCPLDEKHLLLLPIAAFAIYRLRLRK